MAILKDSEAARILRCPWQPRHFWFIRRSAGLRKLAGRVEKGSSAELQLVQFAIDAF